MAYELPHYVRIPSDSSEPIRHEWDDWDPYSKLNLPDPLLKQTLSNISNRGITAFALGCSEWAVGRLQGLVQDETIDQYLETFWAYVLGFDSAVPPETDHEDWLGPVRGPINLSLMTVLNTIMLAESGPPAQNGAFAGQITLHVMVHREPFLAWQDVVLARLIEFCKRGTTDSDGRPVPRELLDPNISIEPDDFDKFVESGIAALDFAGNHYLKDSI